LNDLLLQGIGAISAAIVIFAYAMVSAKKWTPDSKKYQAFNLAASLIAIVYLAPLDAWMSVIVQAIWATIAGLALWRILKK
jgi:multisubunit Na+/H+ antiporter MnhB subunit